jgi:hypothetical protein
MIRVLLLTLIFSSSALFASDWSSLYAASSLENQRQRLRSDVDLVIAQEIEPFLTAEQLHAFSKIQIEMPASVEPAANPFDFFSTDNEHIVLPLLTVAFVEDMSEAYAWLWANHYSSLTVDEYLGMLRNREPEDFSAKHYPNPLVALHIPSDAMENPAVAKMTERVRGTTLSFILLHQFGHISHRTAAEENAMKHDPVEAREEHADAFALEVMKKNSETPSGLLMLLHGMLYLPATPPKDHPLTHARLKAMADYLDLHVAQFAEGRPDRRLAIAAIQSLASHIRQTATFLADTTGQRLWAEESSKTTIADLVPRRVGTPR